MHERTSETAVFGPFRFQPGNGLWHTSTGEVPLPPRALTVLAVLVSHAGEVVSKASLLDAGWPNAFVTEASLLEAVRVIRRALDDDRHNPRYIRTIHRRGYRFVGDVQWIAAQPPTTASVERDVPAAASTITAPPVIQQPFFSGPEWRPIVTASIASMAGCMVVALAVALFGPPRPEGPARRFGITLPPAAHLPALQGGVATSADGARIAFAAVHDGQTHLFVRDALAEAASLLPGTVNASHPFFSPDGTAVGFFANGWLKTIDIGQSAPVVRAAAAAGAGAAWTDDTIVFGGGSDGGLWEVDLSGGEPRPLVAPRANTAEIRFGWPDRLPAGKGVIFTLMTPAGSAAAILDPGASRYRTVLADAAFARYAPTGHLIAERNGQLIAVPFSIDRGEVTGPVRTVVDGVASAGAFGGPRFAFSQSGALVYVPGPVSGPRSLRWVGTPAGNSTMDVASLLVLDHDTAADRRLVYAEPDLATSSAEAVSPAWRPDGLAVAFAQNKAGPFNLFVQPGPGGVPVQLDASPWNQAPTSWSADLRQLAFTEFHPATGADIWVLDVRSRTRRPVVRTRFDETGARYSPDGRWLAYLTNQPGTWHAVVRSESGTVSARVPADRLLPRSLAPESNGRQLRVVESWFAELAGRMRVPA